jgi:hypothetical protein
MKKTILSWGCFALALISFAPASQAQKKESTSRSPIHSSSSYWGSHQYMNIDVDSSATPPRIIATYKSDSLYNMIISQGRLTSLDVDGKSIPAENFYRYDGLVKRIVDQMRRDSAQAVRDWEQAGRDREQAVKDREQADRDKEQAIRDEEQAVRDKRQAERDAEQAQRDSEQAVRDRKQAEKEAIDAKIEAERDAQQAQMDRAQAIRDRQQADRDRQQAERDRQQAGRDREQAVRDRKQAEEDRALLKSLLTDVVKEGLAPDEKSIVSLTLDGTVFFVNGKKQSDELQKKFAEKYVRKEGYGFYIHDKVTQVGRMN